MKPFAWLGVMAARPKNKKASRGFEPRSLDSESRVPAVTPRGQVPTSQDCDINDKPSRAKRAQYSYINADRGARTQDRKVKSLALYRLS